MCFFVVVFFLLIDEVQKSHDEGGVANRHQALSVSLTTADPVSVHPSQHQQLLPLAEGELRAGPGMVAQRSHRPGGELGGGHTQPHAIFSARVVRESKIHIHIFFYQPLPLNVRLWQKTHKPKKIIIQRRQTGGGGDASRLTDGSISRMLFLVIFDHLRKGASITSPQVTEPNVSGWLTKSVWWVTRSGGDKIMARQCLMCPPGVWHLKKDTFSVLLYEDVCISHSTDFNFRFSVK